MTRLTIRQMLQQPGFVLGCLGLAACLCVRDAHQFVLFDTVSSSQTAQYLLAAGRALPLLALAALCGILRDGRAAGVGGACAAGGAALETVGLCVQLAFSQDSADLAGLATLGVGESLLVCAWASWLVVMRQREMFVALIASFAAAGGIEALLGLMDANVMGYALLAVPAMSLGLFAAMSRATRLPRPDAERDEGAEREPGETAGQPALDDEVPGRGRNILKLLTFLAYSFIARQLTDTWMGGLTDEPLRAFQLLGALGTLCAAGLVYLAFSLRRSYKNPAMYTVFVTFVLCLALYLSLTLSGHLSALCLIPLFALRKMMLFLAVYHARGFGRGVQALRMFYLAMLFVELGNLLQTAFFQTLGLVAGVPEAVGTLAMLACMVYIVTVEWSQFFRTSGFDVLADAAAAPDPMAAAVGRMSEAYGLSARETEVLSCLAAGRNAEYVSRTLGIAPSTAKSHIAHIYRKTGFNSQQRLMDALAEPPEAAREKNSPRRD